MHIYDANRKIIGTVGHYKGDAFTGTSFNKGVGSVTINDVSQCKYFSFRAKSSNVDCRFAIMKNDYSEYEPYKSNILLTPEEVVLRSLPNGVKDTLNLMTGEYVQRIGETTLDGSRRKDLNYHTVVKEQDGQFCRMIINGCSFYNKSKHGNCDKLTFYHTEKINVPVEGVFPYSGNDHFYIQISTSRISGAPSSELKTAFQDWLQANPITIQYELATPIVKTVDLSDNHVYSYKGITHYSCSSEEGSLVPTLSIKVPTDTQLTIQEQKATTQTLLIKNMNLQQSIKEVQAMNLAFNTALYNSFNSIREEVEDIKKHVSTNENLEGSF